jgi:hypothetical protein
MSSTESGNKETPYLPGKYYSPGDLKYVCWTEPSYSENNFSHLQFRYKEISLNKESGSTSQRTLCFWFTEINLLKLYKDKFVLYLENYTEHINHFALIKTGVSELNMM